VTLRVKKYGDSHLSILNGSPELLHISHTFLTLRYERRREQQLSILNSTGSIDSPVKTMAGSQSNPRIPPRRRVKFEKPSDAEKGAWRYPIFEKSGARWTVLLKYFFSPILSCSATSFLIFLTIILPNIEDHIVSKQNLSPENCPLFRFNNPFRDVEAMERQYVSGRPKITP
jgi:hypothetical protein